MLDDPVSIEFFATDWLKRLIIEEQYVSSLIIDCEALAKQGDRAIGSIRLPVRVFVSVFVCNQSRVLVCVSVIRGHMRIIWWTRSTGFKLNSFSEQNIVSF